MKEDINNNYSQQEDKKKEIFDEKEKRLHKIREKMWNEKRLQRDINESISSIEGNKIKFKSLDFQDSRIIL